MCCLRTGANTLFIPDPNPVYRERYGQCLANFPYHPDKNSSRASYSTAPQYVTEPDDSIMTAYIKKINDSAGNEVRFILGPMGTREDFVLREGIEIDSSYLGEGQEEIILFNGTNYTTSQKKFLDRIETYSMDGEFLGKVQFGYDYTSGTTNTKKLRLRSIQSFGNDGVKSLPPTKFDYYASGYGKNSLSDITYSTGAEVHLTYQPKYHNYIWNGTNMVNDVSSDGYRLLSKEMKDGIGGNYIENYIYEFEVQRRK